MPERKHKTWVGYSFRVIPRHEWKRWGGRETERGRDSGVITSLSFGLTLHFSSKFLGSTDSLVIIFLMSSSWPPRYVPQSDRCEPYTFLVPTFLRLFFCCCLSVCLCVTLLPQRRRCSVLAEIYHLSYGNAFKRWTTVLFFLQGCVYVFVRVCVQFYIPNVLTKILRSNKFGWSLQFDGQKSQKDSFLFLRLWCGLGFRCRHRVN